MSHATVPSYVGRTALVVDDDPDFMTQSVLWLQRLGFAVVTAPSQAEGERRIVDTAYDLALFDLMLENHDSGFVLSYRSKQAKPGVPVILITAVTSETGIQFDAATGENRNWIRADAVLDKPIRREQLEREIERLIGNPSHG